MVDQLLDAGVPVRALRAALQRRGCRRLSRSLRATSLPESLDAGLQGVDAVFLVWTAPPTTAPPSSSVSRDTRSASCFSPRRTGRRTRSSTAGSPGCLARRYRAPDRGRWPRVDNHPAGMFASNACTGGRPRLETATSCGGPGAAETAPIDERDVAAVAARVLNEDGHAGGDYVLTGPEWLSQAEQVRIIGAAIGRRIRFEELSPEEFRRETADSWPGPVVDMLLAAWGATNGLPAFVTSTVSDVVGSPPRTFNQWAVDHSAAFLKPSADHKRQESV